VRHKQAITREKEVAQELAESNARLRLAMDAGRMAVWDVDVTTGALTASPELNRLLDFPEGYHPSMDEVRRRYLPGDTSVRQAGAAALARGERYFEVEFRYVWRDGAVRWMQLRCEIVRADGEAPRHVLGVLCDITERKEAEERLKLLAREVDHRANNLLAVVQATVKLSRAESVEALKEMLEGRIAALAHVHSLLSDSRWEGADLRRLIAEELKPYLGEDGGQVRLEGPEVALRAEAAQSIAMVMHELTTNAVKYGALASDRGSVAVDWSLAGDGAMRLTWAETGAKGVTPPATRGFGVGMVQRALAQFKGKADFDWRREGLVCRIELPAERLV
jgi:PAS domain S-box-containing protein